MERYACHLKLPEFGVNAQKKLAQGHVLVIGAGGLGCAVLSSLAAMGIGKIGIVDGDSVELGNLHRQILYTPQDIGTKKAFLAAEKVQTQNPDITATAYALRLDWDHALKLFPRYHVIVDATDNFPARYLINDVALHLNLPFVSASVEGFQGQLGTFNYQGSPCYRDLFPHPPKNSRSCQEGGVLGVIAELMGKLQALEVVKILTALPGLLLGKYLTFDGLTCKYAAYHYQKQPQTIYTAREISYEKLQKLKEPICLIDVREKQEREQGHIGGIHIPLNQLLSKLDQLPTQQTIVVYCQRGHRSYVAAQEIAEHLKSTKVFSLSQGMQAVIQYD